MLLSTKIRLLVTMETDDADTDFEFSIENFAEAFVAANFSTPFTEQLHVSSCFRMFLRHLLVR